MPINDRQLEVLSAQDDQTLAEWWRELNCWRWPEQLPDPEAPRAFSNGQDVRRAVMYYIESKVNCKQISRAWNKDMTDDVFESFWRNDREVGTPYGDYREQRMAARMAAIEARQDRIIGSEVVLDDVLDAEYITTCASLSRQLARRLM